MKDYSPEALAITPHQLRLVSQNCSFKQACERLYQLYFDRGNTLDPINFSVRKDNGIKAIYNRIIGTVFPGHTHHYIQGLSDEQYFAWFKTNATIGLDEPIILNERPYIDLQLLLAIYSLSENNGYLLLSIYWSFGLSTSQHTDALKEFREITGNNLTKENCGVMMQKYAAAFNQSMRKKSSITLKDLSLFELHRLLTTPKQTVESFAEEMKISENKLNTYIQFHTDLTTTQFLTAKINEVAEQMFIRHQVSCYRKNLDLKPFKRTFNPVYFSLRNFLDQCVDKKTPCSVTYRQIYVIAKALEMRIVNPDIDINFATMTKIVQDSSVTTLEQLKNPFGRISLNAIRQREQFIHCFGTDFILIVQTSSFASSIAKRNNLPLTYPRANDTNTTRLTITSFNKNDNFISTQPNFDERNLSELESEKILSLPQALPSPMLVGIDSDDEINSGDEMQVNEEDKIVNLLPFLPLIKNTKTVRFFSLPSNETHEEKQEYSLRQSPTISKPLPTEYKQVAGSVTITYVKM